MQPKITWARVGGYEVSSKGDSRFSALNAVMPDGRTIEMHYQCDVKGYDVGGVNWRFGKGKPALDSTMSRTTQYKAYKALWIIWARNNLPLMRELYKHARNCSDLLSDRFAASDINQARALAEILNEFTDGSLSTTE